jgi:F-type H+-transporting ATPase subunit a
MDFTSVIPDIFPHYVDIGSMQISQSLIAGMIGTLLFIVLLIIYVTLKNKNPYHKFVQMISYLYETIYATLDEIGWGSVGKYALMFVSTIFIYVMWHNIVGLLWDMIVLVRPTGHHVFRPVTTDIYFNAILACTAVLGSAIYGFYVHGFHFLSKYLPHNGMGIVQKVDKRYMIIPKIFDIVLWLLIGMIEFIGEFGRMMSLTLRLFGNMFVGMILLGLLVLATQSLLQYPIIMPIVIFAYEFCVAILQAFIFSLLTTVYFKLAADHH